MSVNESFIEMLQRINAERTSLISEKNPAKELECKKLIDAIDVFYQSLEDKVIECIKTMTLEGKGYGVLFSFNRKLPLGDIVNDTVQNPGGAPISTEYVIADRWVKFVRKYFPERAIGIEERLMKYLESHCNEGVDPITGNRYIVSILWRKNTKVSKLPNGIIISRNGAKFTQRPASTRTTNTPFRGNEPSTSN